MSSSSPNPPDAPAVAGDATLPTPTTLASTLPTAAKTSSQQQHKTKKKKKKKKKRKKKHHTVSETALLEEAAKHAQKLQEQERKREHIVHEIVETERTYVSYLRLLSELYLTPLETHKQHRKILSAAQREALFSGVQGILDLNGRFYEELRARLESWDESQLLGDVFVLYSPFFKLYTQYISNHDKAIGVMFELESNKKFVKFCAATRKDPRFNGNNLKSLLILPIQRVPRYKLLLEQLIKCTPATHPDYRNLKQALEHISLVAIHINEEVRARENRENVVAAQQLLSGGKAAPSIIAPNRIFIHQAGPHRASVTASGVGTAVSRKVSLFLFNDVLVAAEASNKSVMLRAPGFARQASASAAAAAPSGGDQFDASTPFTQHGQVQHTIISIMPLDDSLTLSVLPDGGKPEESNRMLVSADDLSLILNMGSAEEVRWFSDEVRIWMQKGTDNVLLRAARSGDMVKVQSLIESGSADMHATDKEQWNAVAYAAYGGHTEIIKMLVEAGADSRCRNRRGQNPLMLAVQAGRTEAAEHLLLNCGASVLVRDSNDLTPLSLLLEIAASRAANTLINKRPSSINEDIRLAYLMSSAMLFQAAEVGDMDALKDLAGFVDAGRAFVQWSVPLEMTLLPFEHGSGAHTAAMVAAAKGHYDVVTFLVKRFGVNVFVTSDTTLQSPPRVGDSADGQAQQDVPHSAQPPSLVHLVFGPAPPAETSGSLLAAQKAVGAVVGAQLLRLLKSRVPAASRGPLLEELLGNFEEHVESAEEDVEAQVLLSCMHPTRALDFLLGVRHNDRALRSAIQLDAVDEQGNSILHIAAAGGFASAVQSLLQLKVPAQATHVPRQSAASSSIVPLVDINLCNALGVSPLMAASAFGHAPIVEMLMAIRFPRPVNVNAKGPRGRSAMLFAAEQGCFAIIQRFEREVGSVGEHQRVSSTASSVPDMVEEEIGMGFDDDSSSDESSGSDDEEDDDDEAGDLDEAELDARMADRKRKATAYVEEEVDDQEMFGDLEEDLGNLNPQPSHGSTSRVSMSRLSIFGSSNTTRRTSMAMATRRVYMLAKDDDERNGLMLAAMNGHLHTAVFLVKLGISIMDEDASGKNTLDLAADPGVRQDIASVALLRACAQGDVETVSFIIKAGVNLENPDKRGQTPVMYAARGGFLEVLKLLHEAGASLATQSANGYTALMFACTGDHLPLVQYLVQDPSSNFEARESNGMTALLLSVNAGRVEIATELVQHGADVTAADHDGRGVEDLAKPHSNMQDVVRSVRGARSQKCAIM